MVNICALYEVKRQGFLIGYIQNPAKFDDALAFSYENRLAPIFNEEIMREHHGEDPFRKAYAVSSDFMNEIVKFLDECQVAKKFDEVAFYKLEDKFGGKNKRIEIMRTIKYAKIADIFDDELIKAVLTDPPAEARSISSPFGPDNVYFS